MASFQLHVWGPAFGLDSIDLECLAAIRYCAQVFRAVDQADQLRILPSSDPSICPTRKLPALSHNGTWTTGYRAIAAYLQTHLPLPALTHPKTAAQRADALAYSTFLLSRASALVDLSLYASSTNWAATTRPAYSAVLHFPLTWTAPTARRADALRRVQRYAFTDMEADGRAGDEDEEDEEASPAFRWKGLRLKRRGVVESMSAEEMVGIRLHSFATGTLETMLEGARGLVALDAQGEKDGEGKGKEAGDEETLSLVYACLALMLAPDVPRAWLRRIVEGDFPDLVRLYERLKTHTEDASGTSTKLEAYEYTAVSTARRFLHDVVSVVPTLGDIYVSEWRRLVQANNATALDARSWSLLSGLALGVPALMYAYRVYRGLQPFGSAAHVWHVQRAGRGLGRFGEIGQMLDLTMGAVARGR